MSDHSKIEWTDATWNVVIGCDKVSPGCDHCYAIRTAHRMSANPNIKVSSAYAGTEAGGEWTGQINLIYRRLNLPLTWRRPRRIFVNAQSDLFHADVPDHFIATVWAVMAAAKQHTFQILTKRPGRMRSLLRSADFRASVAEAAYSFKSPDWQLEDAGWPLHNVWLGVSVEDQRWANVRIPVLLDTPAAIRFLSCEPLLGPVSLFANTRIDTGTLVDWVIVGGESGPGARPMHPEWARGLRYECQQYGIPFHFKQHGEYVKVEIRDAQPGDMWVLGEGGHPSYPWRPDTAGAQAHVWGPHRDELMRRVGKKAAGRELDGRTWDQFPEAVA